MNQQQSTIISYTDLDPASERQGDQAHLTPGKLRRLVRVLNKTLRNYEGNSSLIERFDELTKVVYCKVYNEKETALGRQDSAFCILSGDTDHTVAERIRSQFLHLVKRRPDLFPERFSRLHLEDSTIRKLVEELCNYRLATVSEDLKGLLYEEIIRNTFDKDENQQFFTPRPIVEFMVEALGLSLVGHVCDPACGTGGFLLYVQKHLKRCGSAGDTAMLGFEIDERLSWVAGVNLDMHDPASSVEVFHIKASGSLGDSLKSYFGTIDTIITNPPFGSDLSEKEVLSNFELGRGKTSRRRGVLFIERCLDLLRPGGVVAIIIDESVLNGPSNTDTRRLILERSHPLAIISLPETAFMPYASVKSSILFLQKNQVNGGSPTESNLTFFAHAEIIGRRPNGEALLRYDSALGKTKLDSDLPDILEVWNQGPNEVVSQRAWSNGHYFWASIPPIGDSSFAADTFRVDLAYHHSARRQAVEALSSSRYPLKSLRQLCELRNEAVVPAKDLCDEEILYLGLANMESHTGVYRPALVDGLTLKSSVKRFLTGDVLFAKMRPELRKVCFIGDDINNGYTSSECLVLTPRIDPETGAHFMLPSLLAILLRSDLVYGQLIHLVTGIGRPRLSKKAVLNVRLPIPDSAEQQRLLNMYHRSDEAARFLVKKSKRALQDASQIMSDAKQNLIDDILSSPGG